MEKINLLKKMVAAVALGTSLVLSGCGETTSEKNSQSQSDGAHTHLYLVTSNGTYAYKECEGYKVGYSHANSGHIYFTITKDEDYNINSLSNKNAAFKFDTYITADNYYYRFEVKDDNNLLPQEQDIIDENEVKVYKLK